MEQEERERVLSGLKMTNKGETICLNHEQAQTIVKWIEELKKGNERHE